MISDDSVLVLTTRERDWWLSMQQVIPALENVWKEIGQSKRENVRVMCVPLDLEAEQLLQSSATQPKVIVITTVTPGTERVALVLRQQMKMKSPMIIYLSGDATEGFHSFGTLRNLLTEGDKFIVCSEADALATRHCFPNAQVSVIPFPMVDQFKVNRVKLDATQESRRLAFVGRISEQKNLHVLLLALWILRTYYGRLPEITLDVYGGVDNLGSPNMGLNFPEYGAYLKRLAELLDLNHLVCWHGLKPRDWIFEHVHAKPHIFVSPTLHSDENFGNSVLASLVNGHRVVTTAWGGHIGFLKWFPQQLTLVPVRRSTKGPVLDPFELAKAILSSIEKSPTMRTGEEALDRACAEFSVSSVVVSTFELLKRFSTKSNLLKKSPTQERMDRQRQHFGSGRKIFKGYEDPIAQIFFEAYGMREPLAFQKQSSYLLSPWTSYSDQVLHVDDPHRGNQIYGLDAKESKLIEVILCPKMNKVYLPEKLVRCLVDQGYAFSPIPLNATE